MLVDYSSDDEVENKEEEVENKISKISPIKLKNLQENEKNKPNQFEASPNHISDPLSKRKPQTLSFQSANAPLLDVLEVMKPTEILHSAQSKNTQPIGLASKQPIMPLQKPTKLLPSQVRLKKHNTPIDI